MRILIQKKLTPKDLVDGKYVVECELDSSIPLHKVYLLVSKENSCPIDLDYIQVNFIEKGTALVIEGDKAWMCNVNGKCLFPMIDGSRPTVPDGTILQILYTPANPETENIKIILGEEE